MIENTLQERYYIIRNKIDILSMNKCKKGKVYGPLSFWSQKMEERKDDEYSSN